MIGAKIEVIEGPRSGALDRGTLAFVLRMISQMIMEMIFHMLMSRLLMTFQMITAGQYRTIWIALKIRWTVRFII